MFKKYLGLSLITASALVMGCSSSDDGPATPAGPTTVTVPATVTLPAGVEPTLDIVALAVNTPELSQLVDAINRTTLGTALSDAA